MGAFLVVCRVVLAVVFGVAGAAKLADRAGTRRAIMDFGFPTRWAPPLAIALPVAELAVVPMLAFSASAWWGSMLAGGLLVLFEVGIVRVLRRGEAPECHCFGQFGAAKVGRGTLTRNALLMVPAGVILVQGPSGAGPGIASAFDRDRPGELVLGALLLALLVVIGWMAHEILVLRRSQDELRSSVQLVERMMDERTRRRPEAEVAAAGAPRPGLPVGVNAPHASVVDRDGRDELVGPLGGPLTLIVFASVNCGPCRELLLRLDRRPQGGVAVTVVLPGTQDENRRLVRDFPTLHLVFSDDRPVSGAFRVNVTPGALLVADGRIRSRPSYGVDGILQLLEHAEQLGSPPTAGDSKIGTAPPAHPDLAASDGRPVAALYWRDSCPHCAGMASDLAAWGSLVDGDVRPRLVLITADEAPLEDGFGAVRLVDPSGVVASDLGLPGTPAAVLIAPTGVIASDPCVGADDVRLLLGIERGPRPTRIELSDKPGDPAIDRTGGHGATTSSVVDGR